MASSLPNSHVPAPLPLNISESTPTAYSRRRAGVACYECHRTKRACRGDPRKGDCPRCMSKKQTCTWPAPKIGIERLLSESGLETLCNIFTQYYATEFPCFDEQTFRHKLGSAFKDELPESYPPFTLAFLALTVPLFEWPGEPPKGHDGLALRLANAALVKLPSKILAFPSIDMVQALIMLVTFTLNG